MVVEVRKNMLNKKFLVLAIIGCFVGASLVPNISGEPLEPSSEIAQGKLDVSPERKLARTSDDVLHCVYFRLEGSYYRIYHAYSINNGVTWTEEPEPLSPPSQDCRHPCIAIDKDNNLHVAWSWWRAPAGSSWYATIQYRVKTTTWQEIEPNVITGHHDFPSLALDSQGVVHLAVGGYGGGSYRCARVQYLKKATPSSAWSSPYPVSSSCWATTPELAVDQDDNIHVCYVHAPKSGPYYGIRYRRTVGGVWQGEEIVQGDDDLWWSGSMALDNSGNVYVVWCHGTTGLIKIRKRTSGGWQTPGDVFLPDGYSQRSPVVSVDKNNNIHVVWSGKHVNSPNYYQIRYREYPLDGSPPQDITSASVEQENPNLIWAWWPVVDGVSANIPMTGFAFVWNDGSMIKFYKSADLEWEAGGNQPPTPDSSSDEIDELKDLARDYAPVLCVHPDADHNCPINISQFLSNSDLRDMNNPDFLIEKPSIEYLLAHSSDNYYLDEPGWSQKPVQHPDLDEDATIYVHTIDHDDGTCYLQYWFLYYYNDGLNNHEGDWEMIQISFDSNYQPLKVTYSQHEYLGGFNWGEKRNWNNVEKYIGGEKLTNHPLVYVSSGTGIDGDDNSHANYFYKGDGVLSDYTNDCNHKIKPQDYELVYLSDSNGWLDFEGSWGECGLVDVFDGPQGPAFRTFKNEILGDEIKMWEKPDEFENGRLDDGSHSRVTDKNILNEGFEYPTVEISDKTVKTGNKLIIDAYLKDESGDPISGKNVYFYIDQNFAKQGNTDNNGRAYFMYSGTNDLGEHEIQVVFKGQNEGYSDHSWYDEKATLTTSNVGQIVPDDDTSKSEDSTPGFEIIFVFLAMSLILFWKRKRRV